MNRFGHVIGLVAAGPVITLALMVGAWLSTTTWQYGADGGIFSTAAALAILVGLCVAAARLKQLDLRDPSRRVSGGVVIALGVACLFLATVVLPVVSDPNGGTGMVIGIVALMASIAAAVLSTLVGALIGLALRKHRSIWVWLWAGALGGSATLSAALAWPDFTISFDQTGLVYVGALSGAVAALMAWCTSGAPAMGPMQIEGQIEAQDGADEAGMLNPPLSQYSYLVGLILSVPVSMFASALPSRLLSPRGFEFDQADFGSILVFGSPIKAHHLINASQLVVIVGSLVLFLSLIVGIWTAQFRRSARLSMVFAASVSAIAVIALLAVVTLTGLANAEAVSFRPPYQNAGLPELFGATGRVFGAGAMQAVISVFFGVPCWWLLMRLERHDLMSWTVAGGLAGCCAAGVGMGGILLEYDLGPLIYDIGLNWVLCGAICGAMAWLTAARHPAPTSEVVDIS